MDIFKKIFSNNFKKSNGIEYIIVGLGNPGKQYVKTRHNVGFISLDNIVSKIGGKFSSSNFDGDIADVRIKDKRVLLLKPTTYMNESGRAVSKAMMYYKIPIENVIVVFDDITLDVGKMRIRREGSHGGHNGIKSIINICGSNKFPRIKIGVGNKPNPQWDLADWVLSSFSKEEQCVIDGLSDNVLHATELIVDEKIEEAMNKFN